MLTPRVFEARPVLVSDPDMRKDVTDDDEDSAEARPQRPQQPPEDAGREGDPSAVTEDDSQLSPPQGSATEGKQSEGFVNLEDRGGWLLVRVSRAGGSVPVRISREALEDHFEAGQGEKSLAEAYLEHSETINAKILELAPSGDVYATDDPMRLGTEDFE